MGTRADFYIGRGRQAEWLGSVAWDGDEWDRPDCALARATTPAKFRAAVATIRVRRDDFTSPDEGWPWPWHDSRSTDYAYVLHEGEVTAYRFGREVGTDEDSKVDWFPDMSERANVQLGRKSGLIIGRSARRS